MTVRVIAALAVVQAAAAFAATSVEVPSGLMQVVVLVLGGLGLRWYFAKSEKRLKDKLADTQDANATEIYQRVERSLAKDVEVKVQAMRAELEAANRRISDLVAEGVRKDAKIGVLSRRIERLSDQILAYESGQDPRKRRSDPQG